MVKVRFVFNSVDPILNGFEGWHIDDIRIAGQPAIGRSHDAVIERAAGQEIRQAVGIGDFNNDNIDDLAVLTDRDRLINLVDPMNRSLVGSSSFNLSAPVYQWMASSNTANEYYLLLSGGGDPGLAAPDILEINSLTATRSALGALGADEWGYGDVDNLGFDTIYVRLAGDQDPAATPPGHVQAVNGFRWQPSAAAGEYYLENIGGGSPELALPEIVTIGGSEATRGTQGSLAAGEWAFGDNALIDDLGFNTIYVRLAGGIDPDMSGPGHVQAVNGYKWTKSTVTPTSVEYYLERVGGGDPALASPDTLLLNGMPATAGTLGSLAGGEWAFGDNDSLGFTTIYVRLSDDMDPDSKASGFVAASYDAAVQIYPGGATFNVIPSLAGRFDYQAPIHSLSALGDLDNDGMNDLGVNGLPPGESFIVWGGALGNGMSLKTLGLGGPSVAVAPVNTILVGLGDVDGDGTDDLGALGLESSDALSETGEKVSHIVARVFLSEGTTTRLDSGSLTQPDLIIEPNQPVYLPQGQFAAVNISNTLFNHVGNVIPDFTRFVRPAGAGYVETGIWEPDGNGRKTIFAGAKAAWTVGDLDDQVFEVWVAWSSAGNTADAVYTIFDGDNPAPLFTSAAIDQTNLPDGVWDRRQLLADDRQRSGSGGRHAALGGHPYQRHPVRPGRHCHRQQKDAGDAASQRSGGGGGPGAA